ncbi:lactose-specific PTS transporter subunit EIIC (plasmid) [Carnobacterium viridans]|uniref:PTS system lactose-specific EIICB component n=2 Tax=Carnobacterium viridans TaxID=174587 RepID=A0A1H0XIC5_9LACT|nr:lactose-specific PTS transporter subunit EIIC [Carnobacterium viridans]UDE96387.1 lactose-specific PTS transporter subunit EIIC [Carnobacterium viridans]SDQ02637.1 PTS system lactose-specific IIB component, Lac family /PTS system lactose-specific IIC component, Lac family [Carnobacterium viridans]
MDKLIAQIEKMKPFFEKVSRNIYLRSVRDGFIAAMPVVLFSSVFMLIAYVPNIFGFFWSENIEALIVKPYDYSMGILGLLVAGTTAKSLTDSFNRNLPKNNQINNISTMLAAIVGFLLLSSDPIEGGFASGYLGTTGLLSAFLSAFIVVNIYNLFIKNNITIKMPEEVPPNISQTFKDLLPFAASSLLLLAVDIIIRSIVGINFAQAVIQMFQPLFTAADGYLGLALIYGAMSFFWFIGIHGPSIVEPAISAIIYLNLDANLRLYQAGEHASHVLTPGAQHFVATLGGTGATLVVPFMFMILGKSKQNKAIGKASFVPTSFGVNEPILFGAPIVLNPIFFVPFMLAPIANIWLFKGFIDLLNMNSFLYFLPWTTPGPVGLVLGTGFAPLAFLLAIILLVMDVLIYYPFFKVYDKQMVEKENKLVTDTGESQNENTPTKSIDDLVYAMNENEDSKEKNVLVLCAGGGTSGLLANALAKGAKEYNIPINSAAGSYGAHHDMMKDFDLIILAPQVASNYEDIKKDTDRLGIELVKTQGKEYISLTRDPKGALNFVMNILNTSNKEIDVKNIEGGI